MTGEELLAAHTAGQQLHLLAVSHTPDHDALPRLITWGGRGQTLTHPHTAVPGLSSRPWIGIHLDGYDGGLCLYDGHTVTVEETPR